MRKMYTLQFIESIARTWLEHLARAHEILSFQMAPPVCPAPGPCGGKARTELSPALRATWAAQEGLCWSWLSFPDRPHACAYWHLCIDCHPLVWPMDSRSRNRHSHPWEQVRAHDRRRGRTRLAVGDFYLTTPPPEYLANFYAGLAESHLRTAGPSTRARSCSRSRSSTRARSRSLSRSSDRSLLEPPGGSHLGASEAPPLRSCLRAEGAVTTAMRHVDLPRCTGTCDHTHRCRLAEGVETRAVEREDRQPVPWGQGYCDACSRGFATRTAESDEVRLQHREPWERYNAFLCTRCRPRLLGGQGLYLDTLKDEARAFFKPAGPSRAERLAQLGAPYTPKL